MGEKKSKKSDKVKKEKRKEEEEEAGNEALSDARMDTSTVSDGEQNKKKLERKEKKEKKSKKSKKSDKPDKTSKDDDASADTPSRKRKEVGNDNDEGTTAADTSTTQSTKADVDTAVDTPTPAPTDGDAADDDKTSSRKKRRQEYWDKKNAGKEAKKAVEALERQAAEEKELIEKKEAAEKRASEKPLNSSGRSRDRYILFVGNMSYRTRKEDIEKHFGRFGGLISIRLLTDKLTKKPKGTAFIEYDNYESHGVSNHVVELHVETSQIKKKSIQRPEFGIIFSL